MMEEIGSPERLRQLAADALREYRKRKRNGEHYGQGLSYGQYIAYKSAARRVDWDQQWGAK